MLPRVIRNVRGTLFVDYVRMLRAYKGVDWSRHLPPEDVAYLSAPIGSGDWYPMATFERFGLAILRVVARGELSAVHDFGRASIDWLVVAHENLVERGDPRETLARFQVLRQSLFDFPALELESVDGDEAAAIVDYGMGSAAEEAAAHQTVGFFERLLEVAGARDVDVAILTQRWAGDPQTRIGMRWTMA